MRIGLQVPNFTFPGGAAELRSHLTNIAKTADNVGFASLWVMDHFFQIQMVGPVEHEMLEGYSTLNFMAALTQNIKLGTMVTGVIYRHPGILVKSVSTLDVLSGGRAYLGIGAAWNEREAHGLGIPFPPLKERFERLEETLKIAHQMWADDLTPINGHYYQLAEPLNHPQPLTKPHPPILIGGQGEQKTLKLVAQYADACNLFGQMGHDVLRQKLDVLKGHCDTIGRDYATIEKTALMSVNLGPGGQSAADLVAACKALAELGFQQLIFNMRDVETITPLETIGREIIPAVAGF